jgi:hypothetical protein
VHARHVDARQHHLRPVRLRRRPQRPQAVTGDPHGAHLALLLGPRERRHRAHVALRPVSLGHKMQQDDVEDIGAQLPQKALDVLRGLRAGPRGDLSSDHHLVAGDFLQCPCDVRVRAVRVGRVPKGDAALVRQPQQARQPIHSQVGLFRPAGPAVGACAKGQARDAQPRFPKLDDVHSYKLNTKGFPSPSTWCTTSIHSLMGMDCGHLSSHSRHWIHSAACTL